MTRRPPGHAPGSGRLAAGAWQRAPGSGRLAPGRLAPGRWLADSRRHLAAAPRAQAIGANGSLR